MFRIHELWPEAIAVYMQGVPTKGYYDPEGNRNGWQVSVGEVGDRDLKFFDAVYDRIMRRANGDASRVYACGHSNGGRFTYLLWSARGDRFAAFGPSAAPGFRVLKGAQPKPAFVMGGTEDRLVPFAAQRATIDEIKRLNGVSGAGKTEGYITTYVGKSAYLKTYIFPGGHRYPQEALRPLVNFFKSHRK
jgi:polyhydroxybutyrate depolymerase